MSQLTVNGKDLKLDISPQISLKDLIEYLRMNMNSEQIVITSILLNGGLNGGVELGSELTESEEAEFGAIPFSDFETIEVATSHSRELLDDTLRHLSEYSEFLSGLSKRTADVIEKAEFHQALNDLVNGLTTFSEGISSTKKILKASPRPEVTAMENELLALLQALYDSYRGNHFDKAQQLRQILEERLPTNLEQWHDIGIPALVRLSSS